MEKKLIANAEKNSIIPKRSSSAVYVRNLWKKTLQQICAERFFCLDLSFL